MGFMVAKDYSWTEANQAFSEEIEYSKKLEASGEESFTTHLITDFDLDREGLLDKYQRPDRDEWTSCYKDGSFHIFYLNKFIKENYRFFSKEQLLEMYKEYKLEAVSRIKFNCEERQRIEMVLEK